MLMDHEQTAHARAEMDFASFQRLVGEAIERAEEEFGSSTFAETGQTLAPLWGDDKDLIMASVIQTENPGRVLTYLAENPELAKKLPGMSLARRAAALGRI